MISFLAPAHHLCNTLVHSGYLHCSLCSLVDQKITLSCWHFHFFDTLTGYEIRTLTSSNIEQIVQAIFKISCLGCLFATLTCRRNFRHEPDKFGLNIFERLYWDARSNPKISKDLCYMRYNVLVAAKFALLQEQDMLSNMPASGEHVQRQFR